MKPKGSTAILLNQRWQSVEQASLICSGEYMASRFTVKGIFLDRNSANRFFLQSKIGDCFKTGVSAYERIADREAVLA